MSADLRGSSERLSSSHNDDDYPSLGVNIDDSGIDMTVAHMVAAMGNHDERAKFDMSSGGQTASSTEPIPVGMPMQTRSASKPIPTPNNPDFQSGSAGSSGSAFLSGIMDPLSHTPPNFTPSSYEAQHFGKRARSGSISGRLRSASELEDAGIIDHHQKGILKDLIISGDEDLQAALDKYERGDRSTLENMIKSGKLLNRASADINLLDDLDLDFLTVDDDLCAGMDIPSHPGVPNADILPHLGIASKNTHSVPIPIEPGRLIQDKHHPSQVIQPNMVSPSALEGDDGIGDLEFNGEFTSQGDEYLKLPVQAFVSGKTEPSPNILEEQQRFRSNSLAFGALLGDTPSSQEGRDGYGDWIDHRFSGDVAPPQSSDLESDDPYDGMVVLNPTGSPSHVGEGGIGASLAQYGRSKSESRIKTKTELAAERRREKLAKKEQKEREKREKKERRELDMREKKAKDARDKQERKEKKAAARVKQERRSEGEERRETPSGLGRPRSMSDPNLKSSTDVNGLLEVERPDGWIGAYSPESRKIRIDRFLAKRNHRVWTKTVKYDVRKNFADSRLRVKGRFVKKEDELLMRDLMSLT